MQSLQVSYNQQLHEIQQTRQKINTILDEIEKTTIKVLDDKMTCLKASLNTDLDNCRKLKNELERLSYAIHNVVDKGKAELIFIACKKCLEKVKQSETYLKKNSVQMKSLLTFQADGGVQQNLSKLSGLGRIVVCTRAVPLHGDPDQVFTVQETAKYDVSIPSESIQRLYITAICGVSNDQILVADWGNKRVKLLDQQYQVVGHCDFTDAPSEMCQITPSEVAVVVNKGETHDVQFVLVNGRQLVKDRKLQFQRYCSGIAHNLQDLYLTSGTALYKYSFSETLLNKLYEDTSGGGTVCKCAVSPSGCTIFVTNYSLGKVLTLARDGTVLHTFKDPNLLGIRGLHVTDRGQVLVCGRNSHTILQLDGEGNKKLANLLPRVMDLIAQSQSSTIGPQHPSL